MTTVAHLLVGAALTSTLISQIETNTLNVSADTLILIGAGISTLPDINILWKKELKLHHEDFTHYPLVIVLSFMLFAWLEYTLLSSGQFIFAALWLIILLTHLLMDTFGNTVGVIWLWPFSSREYSFTRLKKENIDTPLLHRIRAAFFSKVMLAEIIISLTSLLILFQYYF